MITCHKECKIKFVPSYNVLKMLTENCKNKLLFNFSHKFLIESDMDKLIYTILNDLNNNISLSRDALIMVVVTLNCVKDLYGKIFDIYLNKQLSYTSKECLSESIEYKIKYTDVCEMMENILNDYNGCFNYHSELIKRYIHFFKKVFIYIYYKKIFQKFEELQIQMQEHDFDSISINFFMKKIELLFYNIIVTNVWLIVELNQFIESNYKEVTFFINSRFYNFYFSDEFIFDYVSYFIKYIVRNKKIESVKLINLLNVGLSTYFNIIKNKIEEKFRSLNSNISIQTL